MGEAVLSEMGEEASKISERASEDVGFERGMPVANLNEGNWASGLGLCGIEVVLKPLALDNVGRKGLDLLLSCGSWSVIFSTGIGLDDRGVRQSEKRGSVGVCSGVGDCRPML
jgi:hypothetical protein